MIFKFLYNLFVKKSRINGRELKGKKINFADIFYRHNITMTGGERKKSILQKLFID